MCLLRNVWGFSNSSMTRNRLSVLHGVVSLARIFKQEEKLKRFCENERLTSFLLFPSYLHMPDCKCLTILLLVI